MTRARRARRTARRIRFAGTAVGAATLAGITLLLATPRGTSLTCRSCLDRREAFLAGNLTVADANAVERHLADCVDCRSMYGLDPNETPAAARTSIATPIVATAAR